jgi:ribonuclease HI
MTSWLARTADRIVDRRVRHKLMPHDEQYGFRKGVPLTLVPIAAMGIAWRATRKTLDTGGRRLLSAIIAIDLTDAFPSVSSKAVADAHAGLPLEAERNFKLAMMKDRQMRVRVHADDTSEWATIQDGVSQGTVSGPSDFSAVSASLLDSLNALCVRRQAASRLHFAMVADDLTIVVTGAEDTIEDDAKAALAVVTDWAAGHGVAISEKSALMVVRNNKTHGASRDWDGMSDLRCGGQLVTRRKSLTVLGYTFNETLSMFEFVQASKDAHDKAVFEVLPVMAAAKSIVDRRRLYEALVLPHVQKAAAVVFMTQGDPKKPTPSMEVLRMILASGARLITGASCTAQSDAVIAEAGFQTIRDIALTECFRMLAKLDGLPGRMARAARTTLKDSLPKPLPPSSGVVRDSVALPPWATANAGRVRLWPEPPLTRDEMKTASSTTVSEDGVETLTEEAVAMRVEANRRVRHLVSGATNVIFTDGSVIPRTGGAGAAVLFVNGQYSSHSVERAGETACSYTAEVCGLESAIKLQSTVPHEPFVLLTDSQSVLSALAKGPLAQNDSRLVRIWQSLLEANTDVELRFIYGHTGWTEADAADEAARNAAAHGRHLSRCARASALRSRRTGPTARCAPSTSRPAPACVNCAPTRVHGSVAT